MNHLWYACLPQSQHLWSTQKHFRVALFLLKAADVTGYLDMMDLKIFVFCLFMWLSMWGDCLWDRVCACLTVALSASGLNAISHKRIWVPLRLWRMKTSENRLCSLINLNLSLYDSKASEWSPRGHAVLQGWYRPWGDLTGGQTARRLLVWWPHLLPLGGRWTPLPVLCVLAGPWVPGWTESHREHGVHPRLT